MANVWHLKRTVDEVSKLSFDGLERFADILREEVREEAPGSLKDGIVIRVSRIRRTIAVGSTHSSDAAVPAFVEFGTAPHVIRAKNAQALRWEDDGGVRFAKSVQHPGTAANPYFRRGIRRAVDRIAEAYRQ